MSDSGKRLKREEDIRNKFRKLKNKTPTFKDPRDKGTRKLTPAQINSNVAGLAGSGATMGLAASRVKDLLNELKSETEQSKKNVMGIDKIAGTLGLAPGRAASKIVEGTTNLLKSKTKKRGGMNTDGVVDLTTEMVIDE
jgi:hypothetical protein